MALVEWYWQLQNEVLIEKPDYYLVHHKFHMDSPSFVPSPFHVRIFVDVVALRHASVQVHGFPISVISHIFHTYICYVHCQFYIILAADISLI
jgi:hypothetical protein